MACVCRPSSRTTWKLFKKDAKLGVEEVPLAAVVFESATLVAA
jgi:hypothetical protein